MDEYVPSAEGRGRMGGQWGGVHSEKIDGWMEEYRDE